MVACQVASNSCHRCFNLPLVLHRRCFSCVAGYMLSPDADLLLVSFALKMELPQITDAEVGTVAAYCDDSRTSNVDLGNPELP